MYCSYYSGTKVVTEWEAMRFGMAPSEMRLGFGAPVLRLPYKVDKPLRLMGRGGPCQR
jgi:hypothetical protein